MLLDIPPEAVALLGDLLPKVRKATGEKVEQVHAAIERGIFKVEEDHIGIILVWPLWLDSVGDDLALMDLLIDKIQALQGAPGGVNE